MRIRTLSDLVRFDPEKKLKIPVLDSPHMHYDLYTLLPGQLQRPFTFKKAEKIVYAPQGKLRATVGGESAELRADQAVRVPAGRVRALENAADDPAVALVVVAPHPGCVLCMKKFLGYVIESGHPSWAAKGTGAERTQEASSSKRGRLAHHPGQRNPGGARDREQEEAGSF